MSKNSASGHFYNDAADIFALPSIYCLSSLACMLRREPSCLYSCSDNLSSSTQNINPYTVFRGERVQEKGNMNSMSNFVSHFLVLL